MAGKEDIVIEGSVREKSGKNHARQVRRQGWVPAILNGNSGSSQMLQLEPRLLPKAWKKEDKTFTLSLNGETKKVAITDLQVDPVKRKALHVDLVDA